MHGISREALLADGLQPGLIAAQLNATFNGAKLCSDSQQDVFWLNTPYEAAGTEPSFSLLPLESFLGRSAAEEIYRLISPKHVHRALPDAEALRDAIMDYLPSLRTHLDAMSLRAQDG